MNPVRINLTFSTIKANSPDDRGMGACLGKRLLLLLFIQLCLVWNALGQETSPGLLFEPSTRALTSTNEELISITIKIVNRQPQALKAIINTIIPEGFTLISKREVSIDIAAGDSTFIPVKVFVGRQATSDKEHLVQFQLVGEGNKILTSSTTNIQVSAKRNVTMFALVSNILLEPGSDSIKVPIRVSNQGNTTQKVTIINRYPSIFQDNAFHETTQFTINPSADTLITFTRPVVRKMLGSEGFDVTFSGLYENGDMLGMAYVRVQSARNERAYDDPSLGDSYNLNSISLSSQNMFSQNQSYLVAGRGSLNLPSGRLGYNVDVTSYKNGYSPALVRNSFLSYANQGFGFTAGNINQNIDLTLNGRGFSGFLNDTASNDSYEVGYIDGHSNLLGNVNNVFFNPGNAMWGKYTHTSDHWSLTSSAVYEISPLKNARSAVFGNVFNFNRLKGLRIQASLSGGHTTQYDDGSEVRPSIASGLNINGTFKNLVISSQNYYSSGHYPGMRKGALSFNQRITWMRERSNIWATGDYNHYAPKTLSNFKSFLPVFGSLRVETGISGAIAGKLTASFAPSYVKETNNAYQFPGALGSMQSMQSWNLTNSFSVAISGSQYLSVNTEAGFYSSSFDPERRFHFRSNLNYRRGIFNLSSTMQAGTFYIAEAANNFMRGIESQRLINVIPSVQKSFFRNKLRTEVGLAYINSSVFGGSFYLTSRAEIDLMPRTTFYAASNHNRYSDYSLSMLELGITQKISLPKVDPKQSDFEVFVFKDMNQNGLFDEGDVPAVNHLLYINQAAFITNSSGMVEYKNLPFERYRLSFTNTKGWYAPDLQIQLDQKRKKVSIPLNRTGTLKGKISYSFNELSYDINRNLQGITIIAISDNNVRHITKTNSEGSYVFYLPVGNYSLSVDPADLPQQVEFLSTDIKYLLSTEKPQVGNLILKVNERKIDTKKFTSPNTPKR